ncbi:MFS transporter [Parapedobacter sp. 10938]|uniref:MFS transporter n=1 Tax=Parapedobacter flavus TaxID=3110225 RepID=UPI002DBCD7C3|nr:MFS transporter [Parapedobacter sp. 10938]MEC3879627.1 MFS transporter [Parapedobacter sp. 10938]
MSPTLKRGALLVVIYLAFISLGLPDSLLGPAWPTMYMDLDVPIHFAGIISMVVAGGTVVSSLFSARLIARLGVASVTTCSVLMTALALLGFAFSHHFVFLCLLAVPLGLGAGCVDAALNNYVALHYKAKHMNWLHCFWGVGAAIGPIIMAGQLAQGQSWTNGYLAVGTIQVALVLLLLLSTPLWMRKPASAAMDSTEPNKGFKSMLRIPGLKQALAVFFCYCSVEATFGLWGASYLVFTRQLEPDDAARLVSLYYVGITVGRFVSGFATERLSNKQLVYIGQGVVVLGLISLLVPFDVAVMPGFLLIGLGCAPIFPSLLHETPRNFGEKHAQAIMGMQMASAYIGITFMPLLFGRLAAYLNYSWLLGFIAVLLALQIFMTYKLNRKVSQRFRWSDF